MVHNFYIHFSINGRESKRVPKFLTELDRDEVLAQNDNLIKWVKKRCQVKSNDIAIVDVAFKPPITGRAIKKLSKLLYNTPNV